MNGNGGFDLGGGWEGGGTWDSPGQTPPFFPDDSMAGGFGNILGAIRQVSDIARSWTDDTGAGSGDVVLGGTTPVAFPAVAGAGIWLGALLARTLGRGAAGAIFTAANGVRVRIGQLWPLVRKYGPQAVAGGLGISIGSLGTLLMQSPQGGGRRRARGISAANIRTTKRTIKTLKRLVRMSGIRMGGRSSSRPYYYHRHRR